MFTVMWLSLAGRPYTINWPAPDGQPPRLYFARVPKSVARRGSLVYNGRLGDFMEATVPMGEICYSSKEMVQRALRGLPTPRVPTGPLAVHFCARLAGVSLRDYTLNSRVLADCVLRYYERFRPDAVWVSADTWISAEAMGARVAFPGDDQPMAGTTERLIRSASDIDRIGPPDPQSQGRCPLMLDALGRIVEALGDEVFVVACFDQYPFSLACALMGMESLMLGLWDDRPMVDALLQRCAEYSTAYCRGPGRGGRPTCSAAAIRRPG